jgi:hypothetical protein
VLYCRWNDAPSERSSRATISIAYDVPPVSEIAVPDAYGDPSGYAVSPASTVVAPIFTLIPVDGNNGVPNV